MRLFLFHLHFYLWACTGISVYWSTVATSKDPQRTRSIPVTPKYRSYIFFVLMFAIGTLTGFFIWGQGSKGKIEVQPIREVNASYHYIRPLLAYECYDSQTSGEHEDLKQKVAEYIDRQKDLNSAEDISVYYRDLSDGRWFGINEDSTYNPASLLKVVLMMAYFREAEESPGVLQRQFMYTQETADRDAAVAFGAVSKLEIGKNYGVEELIEKMIIDSDNGAKTLLLDGVSLEKFNEIFTQLGLPGFNGMTGDYTISTKSYGLILRVLFNASYLNRDYSEKALSIMSRVTYGSGILAGVPAGTVVAQKFGERIIGPTAERPGEAELHNCGIIYSSAYPYNLCVMTKGPGLEALKVIIKDISRMVYEDSVR